MMRFLNNPFCRWLSTVITITLILIVLHHLKYPSGTVSQPAFTGTYNIHFVNYRGRTNVDAGFEHYLQANNIRYRITYHDLQRDTNRVQPVLDSILKEQPHIVVTWGTTATLSVYGKHNDQVLTEMVNSPFVFTLVTDPFQTGIAPLQPAPTTNITGVIHVAPLYNQFRTMTAYKPTKKIGMLFTSTEMNSQSILTKMQEAGRKHRVEVIALPFNMRGSKPTAEGVEQLLDQMVAAKVDWLYLPPDSHLGTVARQVIDLAHARGIPTFASTEQLMENGAAFGLVCTYWELGTTTAHVVHRILQGEKPSTIPVRTVERFMHQANLNAMRQLGMPANMHLLEHVDMVSY